MGFISRVISNSTHRKRRTICFLAAASAVQGVDLSQLGARNALARWKYDGISVRNEPLPAGCLARLYRVFRNGWCTRAIPRWKKGSKWNELFSRRSTNFCGFAKFNSAKDRFEVSSSRFFLLYNTFPNLFLPTIYRFPCANVLRGIAGA